MIYNVQYVQSSSHFGYHLGQQSRSFPQTWSIQNMTHFMSSIPPARIILLTPNRLPPEQPLALQAPRSVPLWHPKHHLKSCCSPQKQLDGSSVKRCQKMSKASTIFNQYTFNQTKQRMQHDTKVYKCHVECPRRNGSSKLAWRKLLMSSHFTSFTVASGIEQLMLHSRLVAASNGCNRGMCHPWFLPASQLPKQIGMSINLYNHVWSIKFYKFQFRTWCWMWLDEMLLDL